MSRTPNNNIQISVQCHPNIVKQVRNYAKIESANERKRIYELELSKTKNSKK